MAVRRTDVAFDLGLRGFTEGLAARLHAMAASRVTPPAVYKAKCENCSLIGRCPEREEVIVRKPNGINDGRFQEFITRSSGVRVC